jgi:hypothetical protein
LEHDGKRNFHSGGTEMLRKTLITLTAVAALGIGSTAMAAHGGSGGGGGGGGHGGGGGGFSLRSRCVHRLSRRQVNRILKLIAAGLAGPHIPNTMIGKVL